MEYIFVSDKNRNNDERKLIKMDEELGEESVRGKTKIMKCHAKKIIIISR